MFKSKDLDDQLLKQRREAEEKDAERRAKKYGLGHLDLISTKVPTEIKAMQLVPETDAKEAMLVPLQLVRKTLIIALFDPENAKAKEIIEGLRTKGKLEVKIVVVSMSGLKHAWEYYRYVIPQVDISGRVDIDEAKLSEGQSTVRNLEDMTKNIRDFKNPFTSQILETILSGALALGASDIHLEPNIKTAELRLRIDGLLHTVFSEFSQLIYKSVITRIKLLSNLKLNVQDQPQDGRFTINAVDRTIEIRTSLIPSEYGETAVLRILDPISLKANLEDLGWRADDLEIAVAEIKKPNGLILNTGPTGSGKTTTLYAFLRKVVQPEIKIITVEDPIEYHLPGISQTQVDTEAGYTFASGLRSILRQDPNVILVGEIRDKETAEIALNASLTGHIVFSTLHTNDAVGAIPRLLDLGIQTNILGPSLSLIIAQRLVRRLCPECRVKSEIKPELEKKIKEFISALPGRVAKENYKEISIYEAKGCERCAGLGYKGRISIFELLQVDETMEATIYKNPTEIELKDLAKKQGMVSMQEDGILKSFQGITSFAEVERLTGQIAW